MVFSNDTLRKSLVTSLVAVAFVAFVGASAQAEPGKAFSGERLRDLRTAMSEHCFACHDNDLKKGGVNLEASLADLTGPDPSENTELWSNVIKMVKFGEMPPAKKPRPSKAEQAAILNGADSVLIAQGGDSLLHALNTDPHYANYVDHDELFNGQHKGPAYTPSRLWFKQSDYANTGTVNGPTLDNLLKFFNVRIAEQVDGVLVQGKLSAADAKKMKERDALAKTIKKIENSVKRAAELQKLPAKIEPPYVLSKYHKPYNDFAKADGVPNVAECAEVLHGAFIEVLRRPPRDDAELNKYATLLREKAGAIGRGRALKVVLLAIHLKPEVFYRMELGAGRALPDGRRALTPMELYYALCHAMGVPPVQDTGVPPRGGRGKPDNLPPLNQALLLAVYENRLNNAQDVRTILKPYVGQRLKYTHRGGGYYFGDTRAMVGPRQKIVDFIRQYFGYADAEDNFKDGSPNRPKELIEDADRFVNLILDDDKDVLKRLLTDNTYAFNPHKHIGFVSTSRPRFEQHRRHYGVDIKELRAGKLDSRIEQLDLGGKRPTELMFITFKNHAGLLTHPVWNFAHSKNDETDPIIRGKWIREKLLAGTVREIPIQVDAKVSNDHTKTLRERFEITKESYCWSCHKKMNPLGMPFEAYNELGQFRSSDSRAKKPIDTTGRIDGTGEPGVDGEVRDAVELAHRLAKSTRVRQSFIRHAFRYWLGRNEMLSDSPTLIAADKAYVDSGGSMSELVLALVTSDSFLYRK